MTIASCLPSRYRLRNLDILVSSNQQTDKRNKGTDFHIFSASLGYLWQLFGNTSSFSACFVPIGGIELSTSKESRNDMFFIAYISVHIIKC